MNVATNVGQEFLKLIDEHFPPGHILRSAMNKTTSLGWAVPISVSALQAMSDEQAQLIFS